MKKLVDQLSAVFRQIEAERGTSHLADLVLSSIEDSFSCFSCLSVDEYYEQFRELLVLVKTTKPRIGILIFYFCKIWEEMQDNKDKIRELPELKALIVKTIRGLSKESKLEKDALGKNGLSIVEDGDCILLHSHSGTVLNLIERAYKKKKKIKVILAEQEEEKTEAMIHFLQSHGVPFVVVPEYMLSHIENDVTKVFLGAITLNNQDTFITDAGTNSVVAEFHHANVPIYVFMNEKKFSLWDATKKAQTYKVTQKRTDFHPEKIVTYDRIKFSHDRIPVGLVSYLVTETGVYAPKEITKVFNARYQKFDDWRDKYFDKDGADEEDEE